VIRAFAAMQQRHKDVMLVNCWFNQWPQSMNTMAASNLIKYPTVSGQYVDVIEHILKENGVNVRDVLTLGPQPNPLLAKLYKNTDIGVFPNRCEGGTNLVMCEYLACGKPVIATDATGHKDVITAENAITAARGKTFTVNSDGQPAGQWWSRIWMRWSRSWNGRIRIAKSWARSASGRGAICSS
jgi:glycosyltransferase involved in cell wall biosynthesis